MQQTEVKTTFYQAVFNGYDKLSKAVRETAGIDYVIMVGQVADEVAPAWNRQFKIALPPMIGDMTVYMDGNIGFRQPVSIVAGWAAHVLGDADIAICKHAARRCAYVEIEACVGRKKITQEQADRAHEILTEAKLPKNFGLWECGIIIRRVNAPWLNLLHAAWFNKLVETRIWRDQIWLPLAIYQLGPEKMPPGKFRTLEMDVRKNDIFTFKPHA